MEMRTLGAGGPDISVVGFGAWEAGGDYWGPNESDEAVIGAIHAGLAAGMNWIDTAEVYGNGRSEEIVGEAVAGRRDDVLVFTKVAPHEAGTGLRPDAIKRAIRGSLSRLGLDHVDLYQIHWPDGRIPVEDSWGAMAEAREEGLTRHIGSSNFDRDLIERCMAVAPVDSVQNLCSLVSQADRAELIPWLAEQGISYLAYSPLGKGLLTGAITKDTTFNDGRGGSGGQQPRQFHGADFERNLERVERLRAVAERLGHSVAAVALRWVIDLSPTTVTIAGSRSADHTRANADAGSFALDEEALAEIDAIFE